MKLLCDFLMRLRQNKKNRKTNKPLSNERTPSKTCQSFNQNRNKSSENLTEKFDKMTQTSTKSKLTTYSDKFTLDKNLILTVSDFCFWYDVRSTLLNIIDHVTIMNKIPITTKHSTVIKYCFLPQMNTNYRSICRSKTSSAIRTSNECRQKRNAKIQTNTVTLSPMNNSYCWSSKSLFNEEIMR